MTLIEVKTKQNITDFNQVPFIIYKNDENWIPHLKQDIEGVFNPETNKFFRHGEACRWIIKNKNGELIGRVAAFINKKLANTFKQPTGGMGFFESINDEITAFALMDNCKKWLQEQGMEAMNGPINFGEKDKYWGLITKNFTLPPYYTQNYNPEYYVQLFEQYGFQIYYNQFIYHRKINEPLQEKYRKRAERIAKNSKYKIQSIEMNKMEKYAEDFRTIYNRAWVTHSGFRGMPKIQAISIMKKLKPVVDEDLIWFVYYENTPVAFYISLPELNEIWKYINGNLNWIGKLKFLWHKRRKTCKTTFGIAFGIDPNYQGKGLEGAIFKALEDRIIPKDRYTDAIITWIGDFNPKMITVIETLGCKCIREMATYRILFDPLAKFEKNATIK